MDIIGAKIEVFLVKSTDFFQHALCFIGDEGRIVLNYTTVDVRGPISVLVPNVNVTIQWNTKAVVTIANEVIKSQWVTSTPIATISDIAFSQYQEWLIEWLAKHRIYSILEGENTNKLFVLESLRYLLKRADKVSPLILIDTCTYQIVCENKERVASVVQRRELMEWYDLLSKEGSLQKVIEQINRVGMGYYHDNTTGNSVYWLMEGFRLEPHYEKIDLDNAKKKTKKSTQLIKREYVKGFSTKSRSNVSASSASSREDKTFSRGKRGPLLCNEQKDIAEPPIPASITSSALGVSPPTPISFGVTPNPNAFSATPTLPLGSTGFTQQVSQTPVTPLAPATVNPAFAPINQSRNGLLLVAVLIAIMIIVIVIIVIIVASYSTTSVVVPVAAPPPPIVVV